jgi:glycosyltransferase involved in cell wall biosynthesis
MSSSAPVSVVIPAYNAEAWIARALDSVLAQTRRPREVVVVDDGSTDGTARVAQRYGPSVRHVYRANAGVAAARNRGIAASTQDWIAFLDADDEWLPEKTERQLEILARHQHLRWCGCAGEFVGDTAPPSGATSDPATCNAEPGGPLSFFVAARRQLPLQTSGYIVQRSLLAELGGFDTSLRTGEDRDLWWRIALVYPQLGYYPQVSYRYYVNVPKSLTKVGVERTAIIENLCRNLRRARLQNPATADAFYRQARELVLDYLLRATTRQVVIAPEVAREATELFRVHPGQRLLMAALARLPAGLAAKAVRRLCR